MRVKTAVVPALAVYILCFVFVPEVLAQAPPPGPGELAPQPEGDVITGITVQQLVIQLVANAAAYAINYFAPWTSAQAKGTFVLGLAVALGVVYQAVTVGDLGWNVETLVTIATQVIAALIAHGVLTQTSISRWFGQGKNTQGVPNTERALVGPPG